MKKFKYTQHLYHFEGAVLRGVLNTQLYDVLEDLFPPTLPFLVLGKNVFVWSQLSAVQREIVRRKIESFHYKLKR